MGDDDELVLIWPKPETRRMGRIVPDEQWDAMVQRAERAEARVKELEGTVYCPSCSTCALSGHPMPSPDRTGPRGR